MIAMSFKMSRWPKYKKINKNTNSLKQNAKKA